MRRECPSCKELLTPLFKGNALMGWICCECRTGVVFEA